MHKFAGAEKTYRVADIRIISKAEDVIVNEARFLFWCDCIRTAN